jgi:GNAT superfamily N-acetyltransferase
MSGDAGRNLRADALNRFVLRTAPRLEDREEIREILTSSGAFYPFEIDVALELVDDALSKREASEYRFILADLAGETVGYVCYGPIVVTDRWYDLYWIAVRQDHRGTGVGSVLLRATEEAVRAEGGLYLIIETSSRPVYAPTRRFYLKHEYQEVARVPEYYGDGDDRVIYLKAL